MLRHVTHQKNFKSFRMYPEVAYQICVFFFNKKLVEHENVSGGGGGGICVYLLEMENELHAEQKEITSVTYPLQSVESKNKPAGARILGERVIG